ncbi:MAG: polysaccharide deacetylase family protein [Desulfurococcales archaeon]|jgi:peptidoglycan/xylan/chitin deacetylase (PgdA/CDA1 family)|nr:polysaccharide deacetylase family protein [Desulfurococcales archaeon]
MKLYDNRGKPGVVAEKYVEVLINIVKDGHEIAHHSHNHIVPSRISTELEEQEFKDEYRALERLFGSRPLGYGYKSPGKVSEKNLKN